MPSIDRDAVSDGLALIEAIHRRDLEAVRILLDHGDPRPMAAFLAGVANDLIDDLSEWVQRPADEMFATLRQHHTRTDT